MGYQVLYGIVATSREVFGSIHYKIRANQIKLNICSFMESYVWLKLNYKTKITIHISILKIGQIFAKFDFKLISPVKNISEI